MMSREGIMEMKQVVEDKCEPIYLIPKREFYIKMQNMKAKKDKIEALN